MLVELYVRNLAVIEDLRLQFRPGLTVLSGDEGAGKSLVVDALSLLLGGRASTGLIRTGAATAIVEGIFCLPDGDVASALREAGIEPESDGSLIVAREVSRRIGIPRESGQEQGRSIARVNGRAVPASLLRDLGRRLMDIHGQMEHLSLLDASHQLDLLDDYAGLMEARGALAAKLSEMKSRAEELREASREVAPGRVDLLEYQVAEVGQADIQAGEDDRLRQECQILARAQSLKEAAYRAYQLLYGDERCAVGLAQEAAKDLRGMASIDPALRQHLEALESAAAELEEAARAVRAYGDAVESSADRLQQAEERLEMLRRLKSKYGPTLEDVAAFAEKAQRELESVQSREERRRQLAEQTEQLERQAGELAGRLSEARDEAAQRLAALVNRELGDLGMPSARFDILLTKREARSAEQEAGVRGQGSGVRETGSEAREAALPTPGGRFVYTQSGIDYVEFLGATNPGEPLKPLAQIASGGETCRFMLAVKSALRQADSIPTLVFDEIDAGIGGRGAPTVGRKLAALAEDRQVICITHLPQIACFGRNHFRIIKEICGGRAVARAEDLDSEARVWELAAMLGGAQEAMVGSALELLRQAGKRE
ncbi:MAG: DNA repair protein RecN [Chloroflexi bacterium]|nr:DNA repair protein RecN [Chloroflexota bacterium]